MKQKLADRVNAAVATTEIAGMADQFKAQLADERTRLEKVLRDPWDTLEVRGQADSLARLCPLCSAWVWSSTKHRDWHLRNLQ